MKKIFCKNQSEFNEAVKESDALIILKDTTEVININAELRGNSSAVLRENSSAELWGNSSAELWGNSSAELWDNSSAVLRENSSAELRGNSSAVLRDNSSAELWGNSSAELWDNSSAELRGNSSGSVFDNAHILIMDNLNGHKLKSCGNGSIKNYKDPYYDKNILDLFEKENGLQVLYKVVDEKTLCGLQQGGIPYEVGREVVCPDFDPNPERECGGGLHLCLEPSHTLKFGKGKILKCLADPVDIVIYPKSIEKVRCRAVKVVAEVDIRGNEINKDGPMNKEEHDAGNTV